MRKNRLLILILLLFVLIQVGCSGAVSDTTNDEEESMQNEDIMYSPDELRALYPDWYDENGDLIYPLTMDNPEWKSLGNDERLEVCQIPKEILRSLTTEEVLYMVQFYPNMPIYYPFITEEEGYIYMQENVNVIQELESRDDYVQVVLKAYVEWEIPLESAFDYDKYISEDTVVEDMNAVMQNEEFLILVRQDTRQSFIVEIMEMILASEKVQSHLTAEEMQIYTDALAEKASMKEISEIFTN